MAQSYSTLSLERAADMLALQITIGALPEKQAMSNALSGALIGGGVGAGAGLLSSMMSDDEDPRWGRNLMLGGLLGAGVGGAAGLGTSLIGEATKPSKAQEFINKYTEIQKQELANQKPVKDPVTGVVRSVTNSLNDWWKGKQPEAKPNAAGIPELLAAPGDAPPQPDAPVTTPLAYDKWPERQLNTKIPELLAAPGQAPQQPRPASPVTTPLTYDKWPHAFDKDVKTYGVNADKVEGLRPGAATAGQLIDEYTGRIPTTVATSALGYMAGSKLDNLRRDSRSVTPRTIKDLSPEQLKLLPKSTAARIEQFQADALTNGPENTITPRSIKALQPERLNSPSASPAAARMFKNIPVADDAVSSHRNLTPRLPSRNTGWAATDVPKNVQNEWQHQVRQKLFKRPISGRLFGTAAGGVLQPFATRLLERAAGE